MGFDRSLRATLLLCLAALVACGPGESSPDASDQIPDASVEAPDASTPDAGDQGPGPLAAEDVAEALTSAYCVVLNRCLVYAGPLSEETCARIAAPWFADRSPYNAPQGIEDAIAAGDIEYDPVQGRACVEAIAAAGCNDHALSNADIGSVGHPACNAAFVPKLAEGAPCGANVACATRLCVQHEELNSCGAVCGAAITPCFEDNYCAAGERCVWARNALAGVCQPLAQLGEDCSSITCVEGLVCGWSEESGPHCAVPHEPGTSCADDSACPDDETCTYDATHPELEFPVCVPVPTTVGAPCAATGFCAGALACTDLRPTPVCAPFPLAGAPCVQGRCYESAECDHETNTCVAAGAIGDRCESRRCDPSLMCGWNEAGTELTCFAPSPVGGPCGGPRNLPCVEDAYCARSEDGLVCVARAALGEDCSSGPCAVGLECSFGGGAPVCVVAPPPPGLGEACGGACAEGWCDDLGFCVPFPMAGEPCAMGRCDDSAECLPGEQPDTYTCVAKLPLGADCADTSLRCAGDATCAWDESEEKPVCRAFVDEGFSCADGSPCRAGFSCLPVDGEQRCVRLPSVGSPCTERRECGQDGWCREEALTDENMVCAVAGRVGDRCERSACALENRCIRTNELDGFGNPIRRCEARPKEGDRCVNNGTQRGDCLAGAQLTCVPTAPAATSEALDWRCRRLRKYGESCETPLECGGYDSDLTCGPGRTCVKKPGLGEPCLVIVAGTAGGELCNPTEAWCDVSSHTCVAHAVEGEPCTSASACGKWASCDDGVCSALLAGRLCSAD